MNSVLVRLLRLSLYLLVTLLVSLAILVTSLRIALPKLNHFQDAIQTWVSKSAGIDFEIDSVSGFWRNTHPSIALEGLAADLPDNSNIHLSANTLEVEFDLIQSLLQLQPIVTDLTVDQFKLDIRSVDLFESSDESLETVPEHDSSVISKLDRLLLRQLDDFTMTNSWIIYQSVDGGTRQLDIDRLRWLNKGNQHKAEGTISVADTAFNSLQVSANFLDHGSLQDVSGEFYVAAEHIRVTPWIPADIQEKTGIEKGLVSFSSWLTLERSRPVDAYVDINPSELVWNDGEEHILMLESGIIKLLPSEQGWVLNGHSLKMRTDEIEWPELDIAFKWQPSEWRLNLSHLDLVALRPLTGMVPDFGDSAALIEELDFTGQLEDIRISKGEDLESLKYSADLTEVGMAQWELLPEVHHASISVSGNTAQAKASVSLIDDALPYGDVFQAPLNIRQGQVDIIWQNTEEGWSLWADKVTAATPDLQVLGAFRLDFPEGRSPFLSFYAEADLYNASQTWRYLPTLALGQSLTDYLSTAIQAGKVSTSKLLWYGELGNFPYQENNGMFQALVGLREAKFSFDTAWPPITDLQLDLLFENDAMYLDSRDATLMDVHGKRITGRIPRLASLGHIEIEASAVGEGNAVRDYMTSSPLVDSVGAALTAIQIDGEVTSEFELYIPFHDGEEARAWGFAELADNHVEIEAPPMTLENVTGRIEFDNDVVKAAGLSANLLKQPLSLDFSGENSGSGYAVGIDLLGDWDIEPLAPYIGERWTQDISGHAPWQSAINIQLNDVGFTYQIDLNADMKMVKSDYPYPLNKPLKTKGQARLQASGNQESISARLLLPRAKYQAEIDIRPDTPVITATNLVVGNGSFKISPVVGHHAQIRTEKFDLDKWLNISHRPVPEKKAILDELNTPTIPTPQRVNINVADLTLAGIEWHDVDFSARRKNLGWYFDLESQEARGEASYIEPYDLSVSLERLHIYIPALDEIDNEQGLLNVEPGPVELISSFDRTFHENMPNLTLAIDDFWLQGYKVGTVNVDLVRQGNKLEWKDISMTSGANKVAINGAWTLTETESFTEYNMELSGENNSDLMERFGISSGIQRAPFDLNAQMKWNGAPWSMQVDSLEGKVNSRLGKGVISDVSGAARLLGLFSLDSIIRKMQLDFTDVFDKGMAFNSITGSGEVRDGIFVTNDIKMDAVAGEMTIKGLANLNDRTVDAEVNFVPDITSGIPVLTAFAVTPQTAIYVLAITTVISPVVEVFTQVNYSVKGPLDSPTVSELSRRKGEFELPEKLREEAKSE
ncbi:YhdP family protein [Vibrio sp. 10N.261.55.A7]|uniref:YhdP family protein n=1 Tax=Vibrio sp. 10N.261.55.A7 TaxID=1880851 RepID=UPI000C8221E9|nr:YhdP family protein [Vibrio sp. 10N.261.55.A7]PMJ91322.1 TIGR02099 family protein [Vibrio sp. 10N.261.55.A7]